MEHQVDHGNADHGFAAFGERFVVLGQSPILAQPSEGALHDPPLRQYFERMRFRPLHDLNDPPVPADRPVDESSGVTAVGPDHAQATPTRTQLFDEPLAAVAILNVGRMDHQSDDQAEGVDDDMALAPKRFLTRVVPAVPPFSAVLTVWLSMMPALGVGFRPARRRTCDRSRS